MRHVEDTWQSQNKSTTTTLFSRCLTYTILVVSGRETSVKYRARSIRSRVYFISSAMEKSVDLVPALVTFLAAAHVIALVTLTCYPLYFE
ncbi:unnamed protein product [Brassica rapa]|uniref:Uncharacterized protein n=2 Tax=Brassica TaxID=3705 RepID=A0A8D9D7G4_BRACM|nr:unnamed protein product [Brassica napus]CAG7872080.1 unnamed protein product [Brassica rapa]